MTPISWSSDSVPAPGPSGPVTASMMVASSGSGGISAAGPHCANRSASKDPAGTDKNKPCDPASG